MSRSIKSLKKLRGMIGQKVKVCTLDNVVGVCLVTEDITGDICLISKDKKLLTTKYFWDINDTDIGRIKNCTDAYVTGHFCCYEHQLTGELKWVTSSVSRNKTVKKSEKPVVEDKLAQSAEPSQQDILKEILETLKEIKNEIAKR